MTSRASESSAKTRCVSAMISARRGEGEEGTNGEGSVVVSMGMMQRTPEDRRAVAETPVLALEATRNRFDRFARFELPRRLALWGEVRVGDGGFLGVGTVAEAVGDKVLCGMRSE